MIGKTYKSWKVLNFSHREQSRTTKGNYRYFFDCECLKCGKAYKVLKYSILRTEANYCCQSCASGKKILEIGKVYRNKKVLKRLPDREYTTEYGTYYYEVYQCECMKCGALSRHIKSVILARLTQNCNMCKASIQFIQKRKVEILERALKITSEQLMRWTCDDYNAEAVTRNYNYAIEQAEKGFER